VSDDKPAAGARAYVLVRSETVFEVTDRGRLLDAARVSVDAREYSDTVAGLAERGPSWLLPPLMSRRRCSRLPIRDS
jgi:hypothetical protein